jgi:hypothetical protein
MDKPSAPEIKEGPEIWNQKFGGSRMVIPTPRLIESLLFKIKKGTVKKLEALREEIAFETGADYACPLTTGIFLRICSEYAEEIRKEGNTKIPPYWRVVRDDGSMMEKFPGGPEAQVEKLREEGIRIILKGNRKKKLAVE